MKRNWLEWLVLGTSVAAILALVAYLALQVVAETEPAEIAVEPRPAEARSTPTGWTMPVIVRNAGVEPAAGVVIEATAPVSGEEETAELVVELLPGTSEVELVVGFSAEPEREPTVRLVGYSSP